MLRIHFAMLGFLLLLTGAIGGCSYGGAGSVSTDLPQSVSLAKSPEGSASSSAVGSVSDQIERYSNRNSCRWALCKTTECFLYAPQRQ